MILKKDDSFKLHVKLIFIQLNRLKWLVMTNVKAKFMEWVERDWQNCMIEKKTVYHFDKEDSEQFRAKLLYL